VADVFADSVVDAGAGFLESLSRSAALPAGGRDGGTVVPLLVPSSSCLFFFALLTYVNFY
jgi:hypothetical protein